MQNSIEDQRILGKIMQLFAQTPVLRGHILHEHIRKDGYEIRVLLEALAVEDLNRLWTTIQTPFKFCVSYSVFPIQIDAPTKRVNETVLVKPTLKPEKQGKTPL
jgi:hypothetical protein